MSDNDNGQIDRPGEMLAGIGTARFVVTAAFIVGTLDIAAAFLSAYGWSGSTPDVVLRFIAGGMFGREAYAPGQAHPKAMMIIGAVAHYFIATMWTLLYTLAYPRIRTIARHRALSGIGYGILVWLIMNLVILPLSALPPLKYRFERVVEGVMILVTMIGVPLAFLVDRFYRRTTRHKTDSMRSDSPGPTIRSSSQGE